MLVSAFSLLTALFWFNIFILICAVLRRKTGFLTQYHIAPLILMISACILRLFLPFELPFSSVIRFDNVFPDVIVFLTAERLIGLSIGQILMLIWVTGSAVLLTRFILHSIHDRKLVKRINCWKDERSLVLIHDIISQFKHRVRYQLFVSDEINTPIIFGLISPTIFLPTMFVQYSDEELKNVLLHEWYHYKNRDVYVKLLITLLCCILWWNPCVYLLKQDLNQALELKCDLMVTRHMQKREKITYLNSIIKVLENSKQVNLSMRPETFAVSSFAFSTTNENVKQRFAFILGYKNKVTKRDIVIFLAGLITTMILSYSVIFQPFFSPPSKDIENIIALTPENAYIKSNGDNTYSVYLDNEFFINIKEEQLKDETFKYLQIID